MSSPGYPDVLPAKAASAIADEKEEVSVLGERGALVVHTGVDMRAEIDWSFPRAPLLRDARCDTQRSMPPEPPARVDAK